MFKVYNGYWFFGRPTVEELRLDLRAVLQRCRPDWDISGAEQRAAWQGATGRGSIRTDGRRRSGWPKRTDRKERINQAHRQTVHRCLELCRPLDECSCSTGRGGE